MWLSTRFRDEVGRRVKVSFIYEAAQARFSVALKKRVALMRTRWYIRGMRGFTPHSHQHISTTHEAESRKGIKNTGKMLIHGVEGRLNDLIKLNE